MAAELEDNNGQQSLEQIMEGDEDDVSIGAYSPNMSPVPARFDATPSPPDTAHSAPDSPSADSASSPQPRLPSQAGRALLSRTPGLGGEDGDEGDDEGESGDEGDEGDERDEGDEDSEGSSRPQSILITEVKEGESPWVPQPPPTEPGGGGDEEDEEDWDTDLELDEETKKLEEQLMRKQRASDEADSTDSDDDEPDPKHAKSLPEHDPTGRTFYGKVCEKMGVVPVSYFSRHITDPEIVMRFHGLGPHGTRAIARVLRQIVTCEKLNLSGNWMEWKGGMHIARTIRENDYISELILSDNQLGSVGGYHFAKMLENNASLRKLDLAGNGFVDSDAEHFAEAIENNKYLKELSLSRNNFSKIAGKHLGPAIGSNDVLEHLDLSWNQLRGSGAIAIARGIKENVRLKHVDLSWNGFAEDGGVALADAMATQESITELNASGNRLGGTAALALAKAVRGNEELRTLKLGNNPLTTAGAIALSKALCESDSSVIEFLDLTECPVEYEFLKITQELETKRPFRVLHGPVLRSGNGPDDFGKPGVDPYRVTNPLLVLKEHIVVNDLRIVDKLKEFDTEEKLAVSQEDFAAALETLGVPFTKDELTEIASRLDKNNDGRIYYGDILEQMERVATPHPRTMTGQTRMSLTHRPVTVE